MHFLLRFLPKNHLSFLVGNLVSIRLPQPLARLSIKLFAAAFGIDLREAGKGLEDYASIGDFFIRDLKPGTRPIGTGLVSPVDAKLRDFGSVRDGRIEQIKGKTYQVRDLLGGSSHADLFTHGFYFNLYLSPRDYHHVHAPVSGRIVGASYIPGQLWPVNDWSLKNISDLFVVNERVVTYIESEFGLVAVVMVGATNVGKMSLSYSSLVTNQNPGVFGARPPIAHTDYNPAIPIQAGARLGSFHMGSSVVVLCPGNVEPVSTQGVPVKFGQVLGKAAVF